MRGGKIRQSKWESSLILCYLPFLVHYSEVAQTNLVLPLPSAADGIIQYHRNTFLCASAADGPSPSPTRRNSTDS
jgi:hypothetical protein